MTIVGCDFHPGWQHVAVFDSESGEIRELKLTKGNGEVERFYRSSIGKTKIDFGKEGGQTGDLPAGTQ